MLSAYGSILSRQNQTINIFQYISEKVLEEEPSIYKYFASECRKNTQFR